MKIRSMAVCFGGDLELEAPIMVAAARSESGIET
jgi:hypothetical protein